MANQIRKRRHRSSHAPPAAFAWDTPSVTGQRQHKSRLVILRWFVVLIMTGLAFVAILWNLENQRDPLLLAPIAFPPKGPAQEIPAVPSSPEKKSETAIAALLEFVNAPSHQERAHGTYERTETVEHLIEYYDQRGNSLPQRVINPTVSALSLRDRELLLVSFTDQDGRQWSAPFEWKGNSYLLHWEAMVGFGEISWDEFFQDRPKGHFVMRANFFLPENDTVRPLATDRIVILVSHPELAQAAGVEVQIGSEVHQQLMGFPRLIDIPAMVDLYWPEGENAMPLLSRWLQRDWIER